MGKNLIYANLIEIIFCIKKGLQLFVSLSIFGSPGRVRTADPVINSHLLYLLSYRGRILIKSTFAGWNMLRLIAYI